MGEQWANVPLYGVIHICFYRRKKRAGLAASSQCLSIPAEVMTFSQTHSLIKKK